MFFAPFNTINPAPHHGAQKMQIIIQGFIVEGFITHRGYQTQTKHDSFIASCYIMPVVSITAAITTIAKSSTSVIDVIGRLRVVPRQAQRIFCFFKIACNTPSELNPIKMIAA